MGGDTLKLRARTGATLMAVRRNGRLLANPEAGLRLQAGDVVILFGDREQVDTASALLDPTMVPGLRTPAPLPGPAAPEDAGTGDGSTGSGH